MSPVGADMWLSVENPSLATWFRNGIPFPSFPGCWSAVSARRTIGSPKQSSRQNPDTQKTCSGFNAAMWILTITRLTIATCLQSKLRVSLSFGAVTSPFPNPQSWSAAGTASKPNGFLPTLSQHKPFLDGEQLKACF